MAACPAGGRRAESGCVPPAVTRVLHGAGRRGGQHRVGRAAGAAATAGRGRAGLGGSVYLRPRRKPSPGAVPRLPHYVNGREAGKGRARSGTGHGAPPPGQEPAAAPRRAVRCWRCGSSPRRRAVLGESPSGRPAGCGAGGLCVWGCSTLLSVSALD